MWKSFLPGPMGIIPYFVCTLFFAAGLYLTIDAVQVEHDIGSWTTATATVTGKPVVIGSSSGRNSPVRYQIFIPYQFTVGDQMYAGMRFQPFPESLSESERNALFKTYPKGNVTDIHYDPANPHRSVINPTAKLGVRKVVGIVIVLLILLAYVAITGLKIRSHLRRPEAPSKGGLITALVSIAFILCFTSFCVFIVHTARNIPKVMVKNGVPRPITGYAIRTKGVRLSAGEHLNFDITVRYCDASSQIFVLVYAKNPTDQPYTYSVDLELQGKKGTILGNGKTMLMDEIGTVPPASRGSGTVIAFPMKENNLKEISTVTFTCNEEPVNN
ncbi:hypothetical protein BVX99_02905 [bacterium F16]|nr:hypothetical protein BVX99_02905 [bacterium F16]